MAPGTPVTIRLEVTGKEYELLMTGLDLVVAQQESAALVGQAMRLTDYLAEALAEQYPRARVRRVLERPQA